MNQYGKGDVLLTNIGSGEQPLYHLVMGTPKDEPVHEARYSILELTLIPASEPNDPSLWVMQLPKKPLRNSFDSNPAYSKVDHVELGDRINWETVVKEVPSLAKYVRAYVPN